MKPVVDETHQNADVTLERAVLARSVGCLECGYDLRGLRLGGPCPECGCEVWKTVEHVVDPASRRLPRVRNPKRVGNILVMLVVLLLAAAILLFARPVAFTIDALRAAGAPGLAAWTPTSLAPVAGLVVLVGLWPIAQLVPPENAANVSVRGDLWLMATGHVVLGAAALGTAVAADTLAGGGAPLALVIVNLRLMMVVGAITLMVALRRVLRVVGERSREFRTSRGGRQRIREMIAAVLGIGIGLILDLAGTAVPSRSWPLVHEDPVTGIRVAYGQDTIQLIGITMIWVSAIMLVIGLSYLVVNAWWIRRSLRRPPPTLRELVEA